MAFFNAGLRVVDITDPYHSREVRYYIPDPSGSKKMRGGRAIWSNDMDLDYRGFIYITHRAGNGMHVLEYTGGK